jgi:hypothetical protein
MIHQERSIQIIFPCFSATILQIEIDLQILSAEDRCFSWKLIAKGKYDISLFVFIIKSFQCIYSKFSVYVVRSIPPKITQ